MSSPYALNGDLLNDTRFPFKAYGNDDDIEGLIFKKPKAHFSLVLP